MASTSDDSRSDLELVTAINAGDQSAFNTLYFRYRDWVARLAFRFTGHHDDSLDVLQETFAYLVRKFPGFELQARMTTFLYPAVRNLSIAARRKRRRAVGGADSLELAASVTAEPSDERHELNQILASLSESHREILLMRFVDDLTQPEIAEALSIPLGTVKSRLHHAIQAVRDSPAAVRLLK